MDGFKETLMMLYDCKPISRKLRTNKRKSSQTEFNVTDPYLNIIWATTQDCFSNATREIDLESGFMARFLHFFPNRPKKTWMPIRLTRSAGVDLLIHDVTRRAAEVLEKINGIGELEAGTLIVDDSKKLAIAVEPEAEESLYVLARRQPRRAALAAGPSPGILGSRGPRRRRSARLARRRADREAPLDVLIADQKLVTELLPMSEAVAVMRDALRRLREPDTLLPLRDVVALPGGERVLSLMPAYLGGAGTLGVKVITGFPANFGGQYDTHQGVVLVFDDDHGRLRAIVDATSITAIRTAAVSGVATDLLAASRRRRPRADRHQYAGAHPPRRHGLRAPAAAGARVFSLPAGSAEEFARREERGTGLTVEVAGSAEEAVRGADIVCTVTTATEPVLRGEWLAPGAHINAVGASSPTTRELDTRAVARARLYVDRREATRSEAGEFLLAQAEGAIGDDHIVGEIGEVLTGAASRVAARPTRSPCSSRSVWPSRTSLPRVTCSTRARTRCRRLARDRRAPLRQHGRRLDQARSEATHA